MNRQLKKHLKAAAAALAIACAVAALIFFYRHFNPADASSHAPRCILRAVSGYDCPGCGSQRAFHAMLNGNIAQAWKHNAFIFFAIPVALFYLLVESRAGLRWPRLRRIATHPATITAITAAIIAWWIFRNIA